MNQSSSRAKRRRPLSRIKYLISPTHTQLNGAATRFRELAAPDLPQGPQTDPQVVAQASNSQAGTLALATGQAGQAGQEQRRSAVKEAAEEVFLDILK